VRGGVWETFESSFHLVEGYDSATIVTGDCIGAMTPSGIPLGSCVNWLTPTKAPQVTMRDAVMRWGTGFVNGGVAKGAENGRDRQPTSVTRRCQLFQIGFGWGAPKISYSTSRARASDYSLEDQSM